MKIKPTSVLLFLLILMIFSLLAAVVIMGMNGVQFGQNRSKKTSIFYKSTAGIFPAVFIFIV